MKKILTFILLVAFVSVSASVSAQEYKRPPKRYVNFGYLTSQEMTFDNEVLSNLNAKADWGASFEAGTTYFLHKKPILGLIRIGLDYTYFDLQYAQWKYVIEDEEVPVHFGEIGMQLGPSITVSPLKWVHLKAYGRYAATFSGFGDESLESLYGGYAGLMNYGISASLKTFTFGIETRSGTGKFQEIKTDEEEIFGGEVIGDKEKVKLPSTRIYFGFRF